MMEPQVVIMQQLLQQHEKLEQQAAAATAAANQAAQSAQQAISAPTLPHEHLPQSACASEPTYEDPNRVLKSLDPTYKNICLKWTQEFKTCLNHLATSSELKAKYDRLEAKQELMKQFDKDGDGTLSESEREAIREHFHNGGGRP